MGQRLPFRLEEEVTEPPEPSPKPSRVICRKEGNLIILFCMDGDCEKSVVDDYLTLHRRRDPARDIVGFRLTEASSIVRMARSLEFGDDLSLETCVRIAREMSGQKDRVVVTEDYDRAMRLAKGISIPASELTKLAVRKSSSPASSPAPIAPAP